MRLENEGGIMDIDKSRTHEITRLHNEIIGHLQTSLEKAIRIGELLTEQKAALKHGRFLPWIKGNLPFSERTSRNYMRLYRERGRLKTANVADLSTAYRLLTEPKLLTGLDKMTHCYADAVNQIKEEYSLGWRTAFKTIAAETGFPINALVNWHTRHFGMVSNQIKPRPITDKDHEQTVVAITRIAEKAATEKKHGQYSEAP